MTDVVIVGAGGHAKVVSDVLKLDPEANLLGFLDDRAELHGQKVLGLTVLEGLATWLSRSDTDDCAVVVAIGDNRTRENVAGEIRKAGRRFYTAVHPSAQIGSGVEIGEGCVLMANTAVNAETVIGQHVIINTNASVDHNGVVEDYAHISPGASLAGTVTVGKGAHVGTGASAVPGVVIGEWATLGAGTTALRDVKPHTTVVGRPPMAIDKRGSSK